MEKGFLDIFYDPATDGVYSRNTSNVINTLNTNNLFYASGYPLNSYCTLTNTYRGNAINFQKGTYCDVTDGEDLAQLQPFAIQTMGLPYPISGTHTSSSPTMTGLLNDPEDVISQAVGFTNYRPTKTYPANITYFNDPTFPNYTSELTGIDINGDGYGYFPIDYGNTDLGWGDVTGGGVNEDDCVSNVIDFGTEPPRAYKIAPRVIIASEHFRPQYKKFGRCTNNGCSGTKTNPDTIRFRGKDANDNDVNVTIPILATHFAGDSYTIDPASAGMPEIDGQPWQDVLGGDGQTLWESRDWYDNIRGNYPAEVLGTDGGVPLPNDMCMFVMAEDIPDSIPTFRPMTSGFVRKYFDESANPTTAQNSRVCVQIDQMGRHLLNHVKVNFGSGNEEIITLQNAVNLQNQKSIMTGDELPEDVLNKVTYKMKTSAYAVRYNSYVETLNDKKSIVTSDAPQITETHHIDYDFRDYAVGSLGSYSGQAFSPPSVAVGVRVGDSSSCILFPFIDTSGNKFFGYWSSHLTSDYNRLFGNNFCVESVNYICDAYGIDRPDWLDETVDVSPSITPQDIRPTLGYKVYKSGNNKDGPYFDITDQVVPYNRDVLTDRVVGMPCIDPDIPCYTIHENFIDEFVEEGRTYYYHVTRLEDNSIGGYIESDPSDVIEITVPTSNSWSDSGQRYLSRNSANDGVLVGQPAINDEALNIPPEGERVSIHLLDGYRMEDDVNVPFIGFKPGRSNQLGFGNLVAIPPQDRATYYRIDNPENPNNDGVIESILPLDNTSYQYILGTPSSSGEVNYRFHIFNSTTNQQDLFEWKNYPKAPLNFTKYDPIKNVNEAYMHSRVYLSPSNIGSNNSTININPRGYGHKTDGATDWDTDFFVDRTTKPDSIIGYKMGDLFSQDMAEVNGFSNSISLLASGNASDITYSTGSLLDWFDISRGLYFNLDLSNNGLYALKTNPDGSTQFDYGTTINVRNNLNISDNNISSNSFLPDWRTDSSYGEDISQWTDKTIRVEGQTKYVNASNAGDLAIEVPNKNENVLEYLDASRTFAIPNTGTLNLIPIYSYTLQNLYLDNMKRNDVVPSNDAHILHIHGGGALETISSRIDSSSTAGGSKGYDLIAFVDDPNVDDTSSQCGWNKLRHIDLSCSGVVKHRIVSLNLGYSHDDTDGWNARYLPLPTFTGGQDLSSFQPFQEREFSQPHLHGNLAPNIEYVDVSGLSYLERLHLPKSSDAHSSSCTNNPTGQRNSMYVNVSNTKLGIDESLETFLTDAIVGYTLNTPTGFTMTVVAFDVKDEQGVESKTPQSVIDNITNQFAAQGKTFIFNGDTRVG